MAQLIGDSITRKRHSLTTVHAPFPNGFSSSVDAFAVSCYTSTDFSVPSFFVAIVIATAVVLSYNGRKPLKAGRKPFYYHFLLL